MGSLTALIDADTPIFAAAISSVDEELWVATSRLNQAIDKIVEGSGCTDYKLFVSGEHNFRHDIDPYYKANRGKSPPHREACRQYLIDHRDAIVADGCEADDAVGCEQDADGSTIICGIDKDLLMIPGKHYQWPIMRMGKEIRPPRFHDITYDEGMKLFFTQCLTGDTNDNIGTYKDDKTGTWKKEKYLLGAKGAEKLLADVHTEEDMLDVVANYYYNHPKLDTGWALNTMYKNMDLLWIWRELGMSYTTRREERGTL